MQSRKALIDAIVNSRALIDRKQNLEAKIISARSRIDDLGKEVLATSLARIKVEDTETAIAKAERLASEANAHASLVPPTSESLLSIQSQSREIQEQLNHLEIQLTNANKLANLGADHPQTKEIVTELAPQLFNFFRIESLLSQASVQLPIEINYYEHLLKSASADDLKLFQTQLDILNTVQNQRVSLITYLETDCSEAKEALKALDVQLSDHDALRPLEKCLTEVVDNFRNDNITSQNEPVIDENDIELSKSIVVDNIPISNSDASVQPSSVVEQEQPSSVAVSQLSEITSQADVHPQEENHPIDDSATSSSLPEIAADNEPESTESIGNSPAADPPLSTLAFIVAEVVGSSQPDNTTDTPLKVESEKPSEQQPASQAESLSAITTEKSNDEAQPSETMNSSIDVHSTALSPDEAIESGLTPVTNDSVINKSTKELASTSAADIEIASLVS